MCSANATVVALDYIVCVRFVQMGKEVSPGNKGTTEKLHINYKMKSVLPVNLFFVAIARQEMKVR